MNHTKICCSKKKKKITKKRKQLKTMVNASPVGILPKKTTLRRRLWNTGFFLFVSGKPWKGTCMSAVCTWITLSVNFCSCLNDKQTVVPVLAATYVWMGENKGFRHHFQNLTASSKVTVKHLIKSHLPFPAII